VSRLVAVCAVHQLLPDSGTIGITAIDKRAVDGPVKVGPYGAYADVQADRKHHGGLEKALYAYSQEDADYWASELGRELPPGWFGENLRVEGIEVNAALVGEQWRIGASVIVEVTMPRTPCQTFARWVGADAELGEAVLRCAPPRPVPARGQERQGPGRRRDRRAAPPRGGAHDPRRLHRTLIPAQIEGGFPGSRPRSDESQWLLPLLKW